MTKPKPKPAVRYEWKVIYRRRSWPHPVSRTYEREQAARRHVARLGRPWFDLEPVVEVRVQRRVVGEWEDIAGGLIDVYQFDRDRFDAESGGDR